MFETVNGGVAPTRATKYSAMVDLYANADVVIDAGETKIIPLGVKVDPDFFVYEIAKVQVSAGGEVSIGDEAISVNEFMKSRYIELHPRSSLRAKGLIVGVGVIDLDYPNELGLIVHNPYRHIEDDMDSGCFIIKKGDKIFFTWDGFDYTNCISRRGDQNIWAIKNGIFAYERDGVVKGTTYLLSERLFQEDEEQVTDSGIILSGLRAVGSLLNPEIVKKQELMKQYGKIKYMPEEIPFDHLLNPYTGKDEKLEEGKVVLCDDTSDLAVNVNGEILYRTRFFEVIHCCDYDQLKAHG